HDALPIWRPCGNGALGAIASQLGLGVPGQLDWQPALRRAVLSGDHQLAYGRRRRGRGSSEAGGTKEDSGLRGTGRKWLGFGVREGHFVQLDGDDWGGAGAGVTVTIQLHKMPFT